VDNPVGTGYSYVDDSSAYTKNEDDIAADLVTLLKSVFNKYPVLQTNKFFIFSESYGGKMTASFGKGLYNAIQQGSIKCNFGGVALGDSWINPMSFVKNWAPYLWSTAEIDWNGYLAIMKASNSTQAAVDQKRWTTATQLWGQTEDVVEQYSDSVNFYNILQRNTDQKQQKKNTFKGPLRYMNEVNDDGLTALMNGPVKQKLNIPTNVVWGGQSMNVFEALAEDFMQDVTSTVDFLLNNGVNVVVYTGNLDLICCTIGTLDWMKGLKWSGMSSWNLAYRRSVYDPSNIVVAFDKTYKNLRFYTILAAGHMVPTDQPIAAEIMLRTVIQS